MEQLVPLAAQFGAVGLVALAAGGYIYWRDKNHDLEKSNMQQRHTDERKELTEALRRQHAEALVVSEKSAEALTNNTRAVTELTTIIKSNGFGIH